MVALHITDTLLSVSAFQTDLLQKCQTEGPAVTAHVMVLVIHDCFLWSIIKSTLPLEFHRHLPLNLVLSCKTVGKCLSLLTLYAYR